MVTGKEDDNLSPLLVTKKYFQGGEHNLNPQECPLQIKEGHTRQHLQENHLKITLNLIII